MNELEILKNTIRKLHFEILSEVYNAISQESDMFNVEEKDKHGDISYSIDIKAEEIIIIFFQKKQYMVAV